MIDISPGAYGNSSLDYAGDYGNGNFNIYDGHGYTNNPVTGQPYAPNLVKRGDFGRVCAEFWADGPNSETPPGHWNVLANYTNYVLGFEQGPSVPMTLQWATYFDAADQAGISRIWGGIHPPIDNLMGRRVGSQVGKGVWALVKRYFDGSVTNTPVTITRLSPSQYEVRYDALRGFYYDLRSSLDATQTFANDPPGTSQPFDALSVARTNMFSEPAKFFRAVSRSTP